MLLELGIRVIDFLLHLLLETELVVFGDGSLLLMILDILPCLVACETDRRACILELRLRKLYQLLSSLAREFRERDSHARGIRTDTHTEISLGYRTLDVFDDAGIERLHAQRPRVLDADRRYLLQGHHRAIRLHGDAIEYGRRRPAGAEALIFARKPFLGAG